MAKKISLCVFIVPFILLVLAAYAQQEQQAPPPVRKIPGITAEDTYPRGCVDCHINYIEMNLDTRFSTMMKQLHDTVEPKLLAKAQASAPEGMILKGKHPNADNALENIPAGCLACHTKNSKIAPPFASMIHEIHLTGGAENPFLTFFQGECTHCHKFDLKTGNCNLISAAEE